MRAILVAILANGLGLVAAAWLIPGITLGGSTWQEVTVTAVLVAVVLGLVNALVKPVVKFLSFPLIILTLGLFSLVINAAMLMLTSWACGKLGLPFHVDGFFWAAILGGVVLSIITMIVNAVVPERQPRQDRVLAGRD